MKKKHVGGVTERFVDWADSVKLGLGAVTTSSSVVVAARPFAPAVTTIG
jgi:hypothetical protein